MQNKTVQVAGQVTNGRDGAGLEADRGASGDDRAGLEADHGDPYKVVYFQLYLPNE